MHAHLPKVLKQFFVSCVIFGLIMQMAVGWWIIYDQKEQLIQAKADIQELKVTQETEQLQQKKELSREAFTQDDFQKLLFQVASMSAKVQALEKQQQNMQFSQQKASPTLAAASKESLIFLGSGETRSQEWTELPDTKILLDSSKYPNKKEVKFEGALKVVSGEAQARLVNKTSGHIYFDSGIYNNTLTSTWKASQPISLANGVAEYVVQIRSTSGEVATLGGARIRITTY